MITSQRLCYQFMTKTKNGGGLRLRTDLHECRLAERALITEIFRMQAELSSRNRSEEIKAK